jgi:hypothetical protein
MTANNAELCQNMINTLVEFACEKEFAGQMEIARELFAVATGKVTDEDPFFEARLSLFQHFFVFDFRLSEFLSGSTLFELFLLRMQGTPAKQHEILNYEHLRSVRRSLFRVEKFVDENTILVRDLFAQADVKVHALPEFSFQGFEDGGVFEARSFLFKGQAFFTGAFVFHPREVRGLIEKRIQAFMLTRTFESNEGTNNWEAELVRRHELMAALAEQKRLVESSDKKKAVEILNVNKTLAKLSQELGSSSLVMALGNSTPVSPFVPETPFYDVSGLLDSLAFHELRCFRFKHINPQKLYAAEPLDMGGHGSAKAEVRR